MSEWVAVCGEEGEEPVEIQTESDGTLLLLNVTAQFPGATGLKYRNAERNTLRGIRSRGDALEPPGEEGWGMTTYICVINKAAQSPKKNEVLKRKKECDMEMSSKNIKVAEDEEEEETDPDKPIDLILLGLPWKTTEEDIEEYFEPFGEIVMVQLKKKHNGESKGFGFIKFADKDVERRVLMQRHMIDNRWVELKVPDSAEGKSRVQTSCKVYVGGVTEAHSSEDLKEHFNTFGAVSDVYLPIPCKHFAFITFEDQKVAKSLLGKEHMVKGVNLKIGEATPRGEPGRGGRGGGRGGYGGRDERYDSRMGMGAHSAIAQGMVSSGYGYGAGSPWNQQPPVPGVGNYPAGAGYSGASSYTGFNTGRKWN